MNTRRGWALAALAVAAVAWSGCREQLDMLKARQAFKDANSAYGSKDYGKAIQDYSRVLELDPDADPRVLIPTLFYLGSSHHLLYRPSRLDDPENEAHLDEAITYYEKALQAAENVGGEFAEQLSLYKQYAMEQLAAIYRDNLDDFEMAEKYHIELIKMNPDTPERYYALGDLYERFHDPEERPLLDKAIEAYQKPVQMSPKDPVTFRQVAALLNKYGRFEDTMEWLRKARDVEEMDPEGYYIIATHYWDKVYRDPDLTMQQRREYIQQGQSELDKALEIKSDYVDALIYKGLLLREQAKIESNPARQKELQAEADRYRDMALQIKKEQEAAASAQTTS